MDSLEKELLAAIEDNIQKRYKALKSCKNYKKKNSEFYKYYEYFFNTLNRKDSIIFEKMYQLLFDLHSNENYVAYKAGFIDGINIYELFKK